MPENIPGPYQISAASWSSIAGGRLVESRKLIIGRDGKFHRLAAVALENKKEKGGGHVWAALAYTPEALNPRPEKAKSAVLPTLGVKLWRVMKVGLWADGGWVNKEQGKINYLHLGGKRGVEEWVLLPEGAEYGAKPFHMSAENWDRISCGTLSPGRNIIVKDGRQLRVMAVTVGKQRAALTYMPVAHSQYKQPPGSGAASKK